MYSGYRPNYWRGSGPPFRPPFRPPFMPPRASMMPPMTPPYRPNPYSTMGERRTVKCGELRRSDVGQEVEIAGRVQNLRMNRFMILRDETGVTQLVAPDERIDLQKKMSRMPLDSYVRVVGEVLIRPENSCNESMPTGSIEVLIQEFITVQIKRKQTDDEDDSILKRKRPKGKIGSFSMTTEELARAVTSEMRSYFMARSVTCGELVTTDASSEITLCGWVLTKRQHLFIVLKDGHGEVQLVPSCNTPGMIAKFKQIGIGEVIFIKGILARRPFGQGNQRVNNGLLEVSVLEMTPVGEDSPLCDVEPPGSAASDEDMDLQCDSPLSPPVEESVVRLSAYTSRTHTCGELRASHVGSHVTLMGWLEFVRLTKFLTLRDAYGSTQILISESDAEHNQLVGNLNFESVLEVTGTVCKRPTGQFKDDMATGEVEVLASSIKVLNETKKSLPFSIRDFKKAREPLRLEHRYLDLRFKEIQSNLRTRSKVLMKMREFLIHQLGFVEIETPTLFKRTPGGAREFVVPTHQPGLFYSLVQSPQQLKQLLMVGSMDRYFQVARCYRDETTKADRQPEFTQLDIELSFCNQEDVMKLVEDLLEHCWPEGEKVTSPFPRMTYKEAMETYGSDKPDLRLDWKLINLTSEFINGAVDGSKVNLQELIKAEDFGVYGVVAPHGKVIHSGALKKSTEENAKAQYPLTTPFLLSGKTMAEKLQALFGKDIAAAVDAKVELQDDSVFFFVFGSKEQVLASVGKFRLSWAEQMERKGHTVRAGKDALKFLWVTDFPLFVEENGKLQSNHHQFTACKPEDLPHLFTRPRSVAGLHYDLVMNGSEVGGGSIRIHDGALQERVLQKLLDLPTDSLQHLLTALKSGAPPHGGIALGIDRLIAIMVGANSIRDVIAFPKSIDGRDPLTGAPGPLTDEEKEYYHLQQPETSHHAVSKTEG